MLKDNNGYVAKISHKDLNFSVIVLALNAAACSSSWSNVFCDSLNVSVIASTELMV